MPGRKNRTPPNRSGTDRPGQGTAVPGRGGFSRIVAAARHSWRGFLEGVTTEPAIKQEAAIAAVALPLSFFVASNIWVWTALVASMLFVIAVEFLNTAIERLCDHVQPQRHRDIRVTKDFASAGVLFALLLAGLVWSAALLDRLGIFS